MKSRRTSESSFGLRWYGFPRVPFLLTLPPEFGREAPVTAELRGVWSVVSVAGGRFVIPHFRVGILIRSGLRLKIDGRTRRLGGLRVDLREAALGPVGPDGAFGIMNQRGFDARSRTLAATAGLSGRLPRELGGGRFDLAMRTFGKFGPGGAQIGGGSGLVLNGLFAGTIVCCAGPRINLPPAKPDKPIEVPPPPPAVAVDVDGEIGIAGDPSKIKDEVKKKSLDPIAEAKGTMGATVALLRRAGIFESIGAQLKAAGLPGIRIQLKINVQDGLAIIGLAGRTECGNPIVITINISIALDSFKVLQALAHELVHAKECAYTAAGQPAPYGGHDTEPFRKKIEEFIEKAKAQEKKESDEAQKAFDDAMKHK